MGRESRGRGSGENSTRRMPPCQKRRASWKINFRLRPRRDSCSSDTAAGQEQIPRGSVDRGTGCY
eukprot:2940265-Amphidinium_carterae.1